MGGVCNNQGKRGEINLLVTDEILSKRIAHFRKKRQLTQARLATITGIGPKHLCDIEKGHKVRIFTLARLAAGLGVSIDELINEQGGNS